MQGNSDTADLEVWVAVRNGKTMTQYRIGERGALTFRNLSDQPLVISSPSGAPFQEQECGDPVSTLTVPPGREKVVSISKNYCEKEFLYSAQIGGSEPEDPVVIIDRR
ncbi:MAG: hypothetical protein ACREST_04555 [Steroidobacteraceae bacterium]